MRGFCAAPSGTALFGNGRTGIMKVFAFEGWLKEKPYCEDDGYDHLYLSDNEDEFLAERVLNVGVKGHKCFVRYWVSDQQVTKAALGEAFATTLMGGIDVNFGPRYSEVTGFLWTDDDFKIGGHDLNTELSSSVGKWLRLEVEIAS